MKSRAFLGFISAALLVVLMGAVLSSVLIRKQPFLRTISFLPQTWKMQRFLRLQLPRRQSLRKWKKNSRLRTKPV